MGSLSAISVTSCRSAFQIRGFDSAMIVFLFAQRENLGCSGKKG